MINGYLSPVPCELVLIATMLLASEVGFRLGRHRKEKGKADEATEGLLGTVQATTFAIFGLLVAFTISMAEARFSTRRALILNEANAIGTAELRSRYLVEPHATELAPLFRAYVDARVAFHDAREEVQAIRRAVKTGEQLQQQLWAHAIAVAHDDPIHGDTNASFVEALNESIDLEGARYAALIAHVPPTIFVLCTLVGVVACATNGLVCGLQGTRLWVSVTLLPLLAGISIGVAIDLDAPRVGLITAGQVPMLRLQEKLQEAR